MLSFLNWHEYVIVINHPTSLRALNHTGTYEIDTLLQISDYCWHLDNPDFMIFTLQPWRHPFYRKKRDFCLICEKSVIQTVTTNRHINKSASPMSKLSNHAVKAIISPDESYRITRWKLPLLTTKAITSRFLTAKCPQKEVSNDRFHRLCLLFRQHLALFQKRQSVTKELIFVTLWYITTWTQVCISLHQQTVW